MAAGSLTCDDLYGKGCEMSSVNNDGLIAQLDNQRRKVDFDTYDITVQQLVTMVEQSVIDVAPVYQRQFRWDDERRSALIESIFLGVPVPSLFMASNRDGTWELVDGVQRLSTLVQFAGTSDARNKLALHDPLVIRDAEKLSALNGLTFADLPQSVRLQFNTRPIKVITLSDKSDTEVRFDLFERLNTGGVALTNQEIRSCVHRGPFNEFLEKLARETKEFREVVRLSKGEESDGTREEYVLRFFAFLDRYKMFDHSVIDFLNGYMRDASRNFDYSSNEDLFRRTFRELAIAFPGGIARRKKRRTPTNLYEGVAVGAGLALKIQARLCIDGTAEWISSRELRRLTTGATNSRKMVVGRVEYCRDRFLGK